ncbi:MAG: NAD(P)-dependent oxidoreductase [bacterium]
MNKAAFITGSTGVIGNNLAGRLAMAGQPLVLTLRTHTQLDELGQRRTAALDLLTASYNNLITTIEYPSMLQREAIDATRAHLKDCVALYHLGGWVGHKISEEALPGAFASNVLWTGALAKLSAEARVQRFIFASTRAVYDFVPREPGVSLTVNEQTAINLPLDLNDWKDKALLAFNGYLEGFLTGRDTQTPEDFAKDYLAKNTLPNVPKNLWYPLTKLMGEEITSSLWDNGVEGISLRLKPVFGPSPVEQYNRTVPRTIKRLLETGKETAWPESCGYLYLEDLIYALEALSHEDLSIPPKTKVILLGYNKQNISQLDLFNVIAALLNPEFTVDLKSDANAREDEIFDSNLAAKILGLNYTGFGDVLRTTVGHFKEKIR